MIGVSPGLLSPSVPWVFPEPALTTLHPETGVLTGATRRYLKRFADLAGIYQDEAAFGCVLAERGQEISYEVHEFRPNEHAGDLIFGTSILQPGRVGAEFTLTRGHIHARSNRPEIYQGLAGEGLMLMETPDGQTRVAPLRPGGIVYVPPFWIHRSVNVGSAALVTFFCYPADSGQDYDIIRRSRGMRALIVDDGRGGWRETPNPHYRPRQDEEISRWCVGLTPPAAPDAPH